MMTKAVLLTDIVSHLRPGYIYGRQYEACEIIQDYVGVLIVEGVHGAFPVGVGKVKVLDCIKELQSQLGIIERLGLAKKTAASLAGIKAANQKIEQILFL